MVAMCLCARRHGSYCKSGSWPCRCTLALLPLPDSCVFVTQSLAMPNLSSLFVGCVLSHWWGMGWQFFPMCCLWCLGGISRFLCLAMRVVLHYFDKSRPASTPGHPLLRAHSCKTLVCWDLVSMPDYLLHQLRCSLFFSAVMPMTNRASTFGL